MEEILNKGPTILKRFLSIMAVLLVLVLPSFMLFNQNAEAAGTLAGTPIGNQATANYVDSANTPFTANSNTVTTTVSQVYSLSLVTDAQAQNATPGGSAFYPYTVTNTGNGTDIFQIKSAISGVTNSAGVTVVKIWTDQNGNGLIDGTDAPISNPGSSVSVLPDNAVHFILEVQIPGTALSGNTAVTTITATANNGAATGPNTTATDSNTTTVINDAVVTSTKSVRNVTKGQVAFNGTTTADPSDILEYRIDFGNSGNATANAISIADDITGENVTLLNSGANVPSVPAGTTFVVAGNVITFTTASLPAANTRFVTFRVQANAGVKPGNTYANTASGSQGSFGIFNTATYTYKLSNGTTNVPAAGSLSTNTANVTINAKFAVDLTSVVAGSLFPNQTIGGVDTSATDFTQQNLVSAGNFVYFKQVVTNNGNSPDTFTLSVSGLPAGWGSTILQLTDPVVPSNNSSAIISSQTPLLASGQSFTFVTRIDVPSNASAALVPITVKATSSGSTAVTPGSPTFDLTDTTIDNVNISAVAGVIYINQPPQVATGLNKTVTTDPGSTFFDLQLKNTGGIADSYDLTNTFPGSTFTVQYFTYKLVEFTGTGSGTSVLITKGSPVFTNGDSITINGSSFTVSSHTNNLNGTSTLTLSSGTPTVANGDVGTGVYGTTPITTTPLIQGLNSLGIHAVVTDVAGQPAGSGYQANFTATSANNALQTATVNDTITVNQVLAFTLIQDQIGSAPANSVIFYTHTVTNTGNADETVNLAAPATAGGITFTYLIQDSTTNAIISSLFVPRGTAQTFKVKVIIPGTANVGYQEIANITATGSVTGVVKTVSDTTKVIAGVIKLDKFVKSFLPDGVTVRDNTGAVANPGDILEYTINFSNVGSIDAINVKITDAIPVITNYVPGSLKYDDGITSPGTFVSLTDASGDDTASINGTAPGSVATFFVGHGATSSTGGTVHPNESGAIRFRVIVNP